MIWSRLASSWQMGWLLVKTCSGRSGSWRARYQQVELASRDHHPFVNPGQRFAGDIGFMRVMAFQPHVKRVAAVLAALMDHFGPAVVAQHFALRLQLAQIAANGFPADVELF